MLKVISRKRYCTQDRLVQLDTVDICSRGYWLVCSVVAWALGFILRCRQYYFLLVLWLLWQLQRTMYMLDKRWAVVNIDRRPSTL